MPVKVRAMSAVVSHAILLYLLITFESSWLLVALAVSALLGATLYWARSPTGDGSAALTRSMMAQVIPVLFAVSAYFCSGMFTLTKAAALLDTVSLCVLLTGALYFGSIRSQHSWASSLRSLVPASVSSTLLTALVGGYYALQHFVR
jgi:hypothetical protein